MRLLDPADCLGQAALNVHASALCRSPRAARTTSESDATGQFRCERLELGAQPLDPTGMAIAAECLALADRRDDARRFVTRIRARAPAYDVGDFLRAFHFDHDTAELFRRSARQINFDSAT